MRLSHARFALAAALGIALVTSVVRPAPALAQPAAAQAPSAATPSSAPQDDPVRALVGRLDLEKYKATIRGLTKFGDRRQGTDRNRAANDWIEAQLKSYGCSGVARLTYEYNPAPRTAPAQGAAAPSAAAGASGRGAAPGQGAQGRGRGSAISIKGNRAPTGVNNDPQKQPNEAVRALDMPQAVNGPREEVYCTKVGATKPDEMYIVSGHMDGLGYAEAANDNGSGTALVMELVRIFSAPDVVTDRSIRFVLWNNEETGLNGARAYAEQRGPLQGKEDPPGSGKYPEPRWLGVIAHDMMLFDHGMPGPDGKLPAEQRSEADVNIEFAAAATNGQPTKFATQSQELAWAFKNANDRYATDYPAVVGNRMSNTDSAAFQDLAPSISLRELERLSQVGAGWDPHWHQPTDLFANFSDKDFKLGLNAAQTTLAAVAQLVGAKIK
ncbi:MAG: M20/M25/M40 family metallo-hydrolase [Bacteroidales bacterium]